MLNRFQSTHRQYSNRSLQLQDSRERHRPHKRSGTFRSSKSSASERDLIQSSKPAKKFLKPRELWLLLIEAALSYVYYVISERSYSEHVRLNLTRRQIIVFSLYTNGYSALVCIFIGCLADSYLTYYACALATVILHFTVISIVFMETTIEANQQNPFADPLTNVCFVALALIKASDFTRLAYALEGMTNRTKSTFYIFIFFHFWVSSYAINGGVIVNLFSGLYDYLGLISASKIRLIAVSLNGLSLYLFVYALEPETRAKEQTGLGCKVVGCLILATYYKLFGIKKKHRSGFFGKTEGTFQRTTVVKTKQLVRLYVLLIPSLGLVFLTVMPADLFYMPIIERIKSSKFTRLLGLKQLARSILAVTMIVSYFLIWPVLHWIGFKNSEMVRFLIGHFLLVVAMFYAAILMRDVETLQYAYSTGFVRIYNTRESPVLFMSVDHTFSARDFEVPPHTGKILAYPSHICHLFPVMVVFNGTETNFTMYLSVCPYETIGYMVLDPPEVARIRGYIPLREGPPGTDVEVGLSWPKIYIFNTAQTLAGADIQIRHRHQKKIIKEITIPRGQTTTIILEPGTYEFVIFQANIKKYVEIEEGGLYGLLTYASITKRDMALDTVRDPDTNSVGPFLSLYFLLGVGSSFSYPSLRALVFNGAPHGLMAMSFAFLALLEGISTWICYIGFLTWHMFMTSNSLLLYASVTLAFFFFCVFITLKYRNYLS